MENAITVYVELLDEGTPTLRPTTAIPISGGLYRLLACENYDPEDEAWEFIPGSIVRIEEVRKNGQEILLAQHINPEAVRVYVKSEEKFAPPLRGTYAIPLQEGLYQLEATPHYSAQQAWEFLPGSIVRLEPMRTAYPGWNPLLAVAP